MLILKLFTAITSLVYNAADRVSKKRNLTRQTGQGSYAGGDRLAARLY